MTKAEKKRRYCIGCEDNFYNGNNPYSVEECWSLDNAKVVFRKRVEMDERPPWEAKSKRMLSCYHQKGCIFVKPDITC